MGMLRGQPLGRTPNPVGKDRTLDVVGLADIDVGLPLQGAVIGIPCDHDLGDERVAG